MRAADKNKKTVIYVVIPVMLAILALLIRAPGLGTWPLSEDEYYHSQAVSFIMEKGVPQFPNGGYYTRGIGLLYLTALPGLIFSDWEFAVRIVPLIFGVITLPLFYMFCLQYMKAVPATLCTSMLLLSSWHIEFSRFARFHTTFQFVFILFAIFFLFGYWEGIHKFRVKSLLVATLSIFVGEFSIFIPVIILAGIIEDDHFVARGNKLFFAGSAILLLNYFLHETQFGFGFLDSVPGRIESGSDAAPINLPNMELLRFVFGAKLLSVIYIMLIATAALIVFKEWKAHKSFWHRFASVTALLLPLIHLYALSVLVLTLIFINRKDIRDRFVESKVAWFLYYAGSICFWCAVIYLCNNMDKIKFFLLGYPPLKASYYIPFSNYIPLYGLFMLVTLTIGLLDNVVFSTDRRHRFLASVILVTLIVLPIFKTPPAAGKTTRYSFVFYPLILTLSYVEVLRLRDRLTGRIAADHLKMLCGTVVFIPISIFLVSEDFHFRHVFNVSSEEFNFRMGEYERFLPHWYRRSDIESPVRHVNNVYRDGDVVVLDEITMTRYIDTPYVIYVSQDGALRYQYYAIMHGQREKWTGKVLISKPSDLVRLVPDGPRNSLWLVAALKAGFVGTSFTRRGHKPEEIASMYNLKTDLRYVGIDGRVGVFRFWRPSGDSNDD